MSTKTPVPSLPPMDASMYRVMAALKQNVEHVRGTNPYHKIEPIAPTASNAEIITAINAIISRLE